MHEEAYKQGYEVGQKNALADAGIVPMDDKLANFRLGMHLAFQDLAKEAREIPNLKGGKNEPAASAKAGEGGRFKALVKKLRSKSAAYKVKDPKALAAAIGRKKFGKKKFQQMAAAGRKK